MDKKKIYKSNSTETKNTNDITPTTKSTAVKRHLQQLDTNLQDNKKLDKSENKAINKTTTKPTTTKFQHATKKRDLNRKSSDNKATDILPQTQLFTDLIGKAYKPLYRTGFKKTLYHNPSDSFVLNAQKEKEVINHYTITGEPIPHDIKDRLPQHIITIRVAPNNTITTLTNNKGDVVIQMSAGKIKLRSSRKNYKKICQTVITEFFNEIKKTTIKKHVLIKLSVPQNLRRKIMNRVKYYVRPKKESIYEFIRLVPFNGCRPPKGKRKKRQGLRIFKHKV